MTAPKIVYENRPLTEAERQLYPTAKVWCSPKWYGIESPRWPEETYMSDKTQLTKHAEKYAVMALSNFPDDHEKRKLIITNAILAAISGCKVETDWNGYPTGLWTPKVRP